MFVIFFSDGVSASGLFLGIGFVLEKIKLEQQVDVALATRILRHSRPRFISNQVKDNTFFMSKLKYNQHF
jgi:hypothetical protein